MFLQWQRKGHHRSQIEMNKGKLQENKLNKPIGTFHRKVNSIK